MKDFGLCPSNYLTLPGLSYDAALKKENLKLELITDVDMLNMI